MISYPAQARIHDSFDYPIPNLVVSYHPADRMNSTRPCDPRSSRLAGRHHAQPAAAPAGPPRAGGVAALHRDAAAAVDGQPSSEGAGRCGLGVGAGRRRQQRLHDGARSGGRRAAAVGPRPRAGRRHGRCGGGSAAPAGVAQRAPRPIPGILLVVGRSVGSRPRRTVRRQVPSGGAGRPGAARLDRRRSRLRHGTGERRAGALRGAGDRGRRIRRDAAGRAEAPAPRRQHRSQARRARGSSDR